MNNNSVTNGELALASRKFKKALSYFEEGISQSADNPSALEGAARSLIGLKRYSDAIVKCQNLVQINSNDPIAHVLMSFSYDALGDAVAGRREAQTAYEINPGSADALTQYGYHLLRDNNIDEARLMLESALQYEPHLPHYLRLAHLYLLYTYTHKKDFKKFYQQAREVLRAHISLRGVVYITVLLIRMYWRILSLIMLASSILALLLKNELFLLVPLAFIVPRGLSVAFSITDRDFQRNAAEGFLVLVLILLIGFIYYFIR